MDEGLLFFWKTRQEGRIGRLTGRWLLTQPAPLLRALGQRVTTVATPSAPPCPGAPNPALDMAHDPS